MAIIQYILEIKIQYVLDTWKNIFYQHYKMSSRKKTMKIQMEQQSLHAHLFMFYPVSKIQLYQILESIQ